MMLLFRLADWGGSCLLQWVSLILVKAFGLAHLLASINISIINGSSCGSKQSVSPRRSCHALDLSLAPPRLHVVVVCTSSFRSSLRSSLSTPQIPSHLASRPGQTKAQTQARPFVTFSLRGNSRLFSPPPSLSKVSITQWPAAFRSVL
ncbi:hypothetical protein BKA64DRAFT_139898 [Cadophora sp. MPI-SDFR-AT-0126]|nr:hypothetical protein BKA64DRAFT_139898 [Leotiomycetes sp. MPI-SDFR-AT-0126]